jgi:hypothetical protein
MKTKKKEEVIFVEQDGEIIPIDDSNEYQNKWNEKGIIFRKLKRNNKSNKVKKYGNN